LALDDLKNGVRRSLLLHNSDTTAMKNSGRSALSIPSTSLFWLENSFSRDMVKFMVKTATKDSIRALAVSSPEFMLNSDVKLYSFVNLVKLAHLNQLTNQLNEQYNLESRDFSREELLDDITKIFLVSEQIRESANLAQKFHIYDSEYVPLSRRLKAKYTEFFEAGTFKQIDLFEASMEVLKRLLVIQHYMLESFDEQNPKHQAGKLYTGMVKLSELVEEEYFSYLSPSYIEIISTSARATLDDPELQPNPSSQLDGFDEASSYLIGLKNTARAILWQIEQHQKKIQFPPLQSSKTEPIRTREMQIQKNQAAIKWAKLRLEQLDSIREVEG